MRNTRSGDGNFQGKYRTPRWAKGVAKYACVGFQSEPGGRQLNQQALSSFLCSLVNLLCANYCQRDYGKASFICHRKAGGGPLPRDQPHTLDKRTINSAFVFNRGCTSTMVNTFDLSGRKCRKNHCIFWLYRSQLRIS